MKRDVQWRCGLAGTLLLATSCFAQSTQTAVTAVRFWTLNDATRVVIEATGDFEFASDRAPNPERIFFDVKGARLRIPGKAPHTIPVGDRLLKQIRVGQAVPGVTRIVFDLEGAAEFSASQLTNPNRLIVELRPGINAVASQPHVPEAPAPAISSPKATPAPVPAASTTAAKATAPEPKLAPPPVIAKAPENVEKAPDPTRGRERLPVLKPPRAATLPRGTESMTRVLGLKIGRIVLDAGHGGHDTGTIGPTGLKEKDLVLDVTKRLGQLIETRLGAEVVYTRPDDNFIGLETRTRIANQQKADLFLSVHANSSPASSSSGVETYYLNFTTSKEAMAVAARENASSQSTVYDLRDLVQKITLQDKVEESREFAASVQHGLFTASARTLGRTRNRGVKKAPFVVLIGAQMPSVLAEIGFVSNPRDEAQLKKPEVRQKIAEGLYRGLAQYAGTLSEFHVAKND
jgi:N-acetylmuramoyl-L-alanine amidase